MSASPEAPRDREAEREERRLRRDRALRGAPASYFLEDEDDGEDL